MNLLHGPRPMLDKQVQRIMKLVFDRRECGVKRRKKPMAKRLGELRV